MQGQWYCLNRVLKLICFFQSNHLHQIFSHVHVTGWKHQYFLFFDAAVRKQTLRIVPQILDCTASTLLWLGRSTLWGWMLAPTRQGHWSCCPIFKVLLCPKKYCLEPHISKQPYINLYMLFLKNYPVSMK